MLVQITTWKWYRRQFFRACFMAPSVKSLGKSLEDIESFGDREARLSEISEQKAGSEGCGLCVSMSRVSSSPHTSAELNSLASSERPQWAANGLVRSDSVLSVLSGSDDSMSSGVHDCPEGLDDTGALKCCTCQHG